MLTNPLVLRSRRFHPSLQAAAAPAAKLQGHSIRQPWSMRILGYILWASWLWGIWKLR